MPFTERSVRTYTAVIEGLREVIGMLLEDGEPRLITAFPWRIT